MHVSDLMKVRDLEMTIAELEAQMKDDQNNWLRLQNHIVEMSHKMSMQLNESHLAKQRESLKLFTAPSILITRYR